MLQTIAAVNQAVNNFIWGVPAMVCIIGVGLLLSVRTGFIQIRKFPYAIKTTIGRMFRKRDASDGAMTPFQAVCTALAATVGTGNIAGVAGAIAIGGPGAVFWMWCSALLGMCTKFSEVTLAVHFRERNANGELVGGPMYYIKNGLAKHWRWLAAIYALFGVLTVFGTGNATQVNTIITAIDAALNQYAVVSDKAMATVNLVIGIVVAMLVALVLLGGIRKLAAQTVPDLMQKFLATSGNEHTRFELHTESSFTADLLQAVAEERLDMAFVSHPGDDTVFENVAFARSPFVVVTPPNHPLAQKNSVTLRETLPYPFVYFSKRGGLRRLIDALFQKIGATPKIAYETEEDTVVAGMAAAGFGIAIVPDHPVLRCMDLKIIPLTDPDPGRTAYLCRKRGALQPAAAQRFFAFCQAQLSQGASL